MLVVPAIAAAHPLGNFTINHYAGIRVEPDRIRLDVVIDQAEIPTFQARLGFDTDGDGEVSDDEANVGSRDGLHAAPTRPQPDRRRGRPGARARRGGSHVPGRRRRPLHDADGVRLRRDAGRTAGRRQPDRLRGPLVARSPRLARDRDHRLRRDPGRDGRRAAHGQHVAPPDPLPDEPADPGARRRGRDCRRDARRPDPGRLRHPRRDAAGRRGARRRRRRPVGCARASRGDGRARRGDPCGARRVRAGRRRQRRPARRSSARRTSRRSSCSCRS